LNNEFSAKRISRDKHSSFTDRTQRSANAMTPPEHWTKLAVTFVQRVPTLHHFPQIPQIRALETRVEPGLCCDSWLKRLRRILMVCLMQSCDP
jgi:hypothetical protein